MIRKQSTIWCFLILTLTILLVPVFGKGNEPAVKAVLFYKPNCPECTKAISAVLTEIKRQYQSQLMILAVNTAEIEGGNLYLNAVLELEIPLSTQLPTLIAGDRIFGGVSEIKTLFPIFLKESLTRGGTAWPAINSLDEILAKTPESSGREVAFWITGDRTDRYLTLKNNMFDKLKLDPLGNAVSIIMLIFMVGSVLIKTFYSKGLSLARILPKTQGMVPILAVLGMAISGYLTFVKYSNSEAFCGPIGNCNAVQNSSYSILFGFLPVSMAGLGVFFVIVFLWCINAYSKGKYSFLVRFNQLIIFASMLFFIYLTFLEPFIIGATCSWCLSAALIMTILYWIVNVSHSSISGKITD